MTFFEITILKKKLIFYTLLIGLIISSGLWAQSMDMEVTDMEGIWFGFYITVSAVCLLVLSLNIELSIKQQEEENERQEKENEFWENWEKVWKEEPKIFKLLEENETPDDFQSLISIISEFLDYCWFHPFIASSIITRGSGQNKREQEDFKRKLDTAISEIHDLQLRARRGQTYGAPALVILETIAEFCGIQKENGLGFYVEKLKNPDFEQYAEIKDVPEQNNFVNLGDPNIEILEKCDAIGSAFDQDYEIRDVSTFDFTKHKELEFDLARTLRCCICNILNTRLTEDIVVTLQGHTYNPSSYENHNIKRKFLDAMIIEIWAICGGLVIERKTYSDLRFQFSIESMQLEKDRPKSAFRTKKTQ